MSLISYLAGSTRDKERYSVISATKRRLVSLASATAVLATMAVVSVPGAMAASLPDCTPTGFIRDGIDLTAAQVGGAVYGELDATGCDIGVYKPTQVTNANIHGARYYGVVVSGRTVNTTNSRIHHIGDSPFDGMQRGRAILYINGASGAITGNQVYAFQKNGIEVRGVTADASNPSTDKTSATIANNVVTGRGHIGEIAQNGIVVLGNASATVKGNTVSHIWYTGPADTYATGLLNVDVDAASLTVARNTFVDTQVNIDGAVTSNVEGTSTVTVRPHAVRVDLHSFEKPADQTTLGAKLRWKVSVDGKVAFTTSQGFDDHDVYRQTFADGSGRHVVKVFKNGDLVRRVVARY